MKNKNDFEYKYVAPTNEERKEIESIRNSYITQTNSYSKLDYLRSLNAKVKNIPEVISLVLGVVGVLIFGLGITMILEWNLIVWGVMVGVVGLVPIAFAYPVYVKCTKKLKEKYSEEIIKISDELLNDGE